MKTFLRTTLAVALLAAGAVNLHAAEPAPGFIDFGKFTPAAGSEFIEVHVTSNLISMVSRLARDKEPEVADLLKGLKLVRVNVIGLNDENRADMEKRVKAIRAQLDTAGWEHLVTAQKQGEDVAVYIKTRGSEAVEGIVVSVMQANHEAVLVNVVGDIQPEKLSVVGERFNIEPLKNLHLAHK